MPMRSVIVRSITTGTCRYEERADGIVVQRVLTIREGEAGFYRISDSQFTSPPDLGEDLILNVSEYFVTGTSVGAPVETFAHAEQRRQALLTQMETGTGHTHLVTKSVAPL